MIVEWLPNLLLGWGVQWLGVLSPGPGVALILSVATTHGRWPAVTTCFGIAMGSIILSVATVFGLAALFADVAMAMTIVKIVGASYLAWLAYKSFAKVLTPPPPPGPKTNAGASERAAFAGFFMQISNPKAIVYWLAVAALAGLETAPWPILVMFVVGAFCNSFLGHGAWAIALSSRPFLSLYGRARRWIEGALGAFFAFTAFKLATSRG